MAFGPRQPKARRPASRRPAAASREGVRITHVTETHIHADYLSGSRELAERSGARLFLSAEGGTDWQYGFAGAAQAYGLSFARVTTRAELEHHLASGTQLIEAPFDAKSDIAARQTVRAAVKAAIESAT